jgi:hypothetical protein
MNKQQEKEIMNLAKNILDECEIILYSDKSKNGKMLTEFSKYCAEHEDERFWQALRNWSKNNYILTATGFHFNEGEWLGIKDTFYEE